MIKRKKIRYIALHFRDVNDLVTTEDLRRQFNENSRFISNYLSKAVRKLNLESYNGDLRMCSVTPHTSEPSHKFWYCDDVVEVHPQLTTQAMQQYYQTKDLVSRYEFYLSILEEGYRIAEPLTGIPAETLIGLHQQFRELDYRNEWLVKKMLVREYGIGIKLTACFTTVDYHLELAVFDAKSKDQLSNTVIYRTPPYEVCYEKDIRKVYAQDGFLYIDDFLDRHFLRMSLSDICKGNAVAERLLPGGDDYEESIRRITW